MKKQLIRKILPILILMGICCISGCGGRNKEALENELAYRQLGINKMKEGAYEEAVEMFQNALDQSVAVIDELEIDICYYKALAQYKAGDTKGAFETYTALINYDEKNPDAYYLRGSLYLEQEEGEKALADYNKAIELGKTDIALYNRIADQLRASQMEQEAQEFLKLAVEVPGDEAEDYREKGYAYCLLEQHESARTYLDKAINMEDTKAIYYLAMMLEAQGETEQANQLYESYVEEHNGDSEMLYDLGLTAMEDGNYEQSLKFFEKALAQEKIVNEQEIRKHEIVVLERMLEFKKAKEKMASYVSDYPEDEVALREYEFLKSR